MFFLIDKPIWISSFDVIRKLRKTLNTKRMWHAWTLDPLATWCLLVATNNSTKLLPLLEWSDKTYEFTVDISGTSPSLDLGTEVTQSNSKEYISRSNEELIAYLESQTEQIPPQYSALHIDWRRAYELARENINFTIKPRQIIVKDVRIIECTLPKITLSIRISSGWYIRSFAPIIWQFYGTEWWYITHLRRKIIHTQYANLWTNISHDLETINHDRCLARSILFPHITTISIDEQALKQLQEWRIITYISGCNWIIWQLYFLDYLDSWSSIVQYLEDGYHIIRNDI